MHTNALAKILIIVLLRDAVVKYKPHVGGEGPEFSRFLNVFSGFLYLSNIGVDGGDVHGALDDRSV
eukprot:991997-Amorphochlora_amoeboformis.AAC.1